MIAWSSCNRVSSTGAGERVPGHIPGTRHSLRPVVRTFPANKRFSRREKAAETGSLARLGTARSNCFMRAVRRPGARVRTIEIRAGVQFHPALRAAASASPEARRYRPSTCRVGALAPAERTASPRPIRSAGPSSPRRASRPAGAADAEAPAAGAVSSDPVDRWRHQWRPKVQRQRRPLRARSARHPPSP